MYLETRKKKPDYSKPARTFFNPSDDVHGDDLLYDLVLRGDGFYGHDGDAHDDGGLCRHHELAILLQNHMDGPLHKSSSLR